MGRKGFVFTIDALLAAILLTVGITLVMTIAVSPNDTTTISYYSEDVITVLDTLTVAEVNTTEIQAWYDAGYISDMNNTVLYEIGALWAKGHSGVAENLTLFVLTNWVPDRFGVAFYAEDDEIATVNAVNETAEKIKRRSLAVTKRSITGIALAKPIEGSSASAYLRKIVDKRTSSFIYFGGFIGQGNITVIDENIPADANISAMYLELDVPENFDFYVNGSFCSSHQSELTGFTVEIYNVTNCSDFINLGGQTTYELRFNSSVNNAYVAGGLLKVDYTTNELLTNIFYGYKKIFLPGVAGVVNIYDGFHVPGTLNNISAYLHYSADHSGAAENNTFYFQVGNETIYFDRNSTTIQTINLDDINFSALNYTQLSNTTVPIRIGFENLTFERIYTGNANIIFVTDVSGSMDWRMNYAGGSCGGCPGNFCCGVIRNCLDASLYDGDTERLSLAKCLSKDFIVEMLNYTNNFVGLVSYNDNTDSTLGLTDDYTALETEIDTYDGDDATCICCGINSAVNELDLSTTTYVNMRDTWLYNDSYLDSIPPVDGEGDLWYERTYDDTSWTAQDTILGATNGDVYNPTVDNEISTALGGAGTALYPDLWDMSNDLPAPVDFSSGFNTTGNTFGAGAGDDGWDWARNVYDASTRDMTSHYDPDGDSDGVTIDGTGRILIDIGGASCSGCGYRDSGAFGIEFTINATMYDMIVNNNGVATVSFQYDAYDRENWYHNNAAATEESCWLKARFGNATSMNYLGYDLDSSGGGDSPSDASLEIMWDHSNDNSQEWDEDSWRGDYDMDGDGDRNRGIFSEDVSAYITGPGTYYLEVGAKFDAVDGWQGSGEGIRAFYDNIELEITNHTDVYYFRKHFNLASIDSIRGVLNVLSDNNAEVYVNDILMDTDTEIHEAEYWNRRGINVPADFLRVGDNVISAKVMNNLNAAKFDVEFLTINTTQAQAIFLMTDGEANRDCGSGNAIQDAIDAACSASENYGIKVYAVGFSDGADEDTLMDIAQCGNGLYRKSDNATDLKDFYDDVAYDILVGSRHSQIVEFTAGTFTDSELYPDSYIELWYDPVISEPQPGDISLSFQTERFGGCNYDVNIPAGVRIIDAKVTSYSGEHWTDLVMHNQTIVYNLSEFSMNYETLGDPFLVDIPADLFQSGVNPITLRIGDAPDDIYNCSENNTLIYTALFTAATSRTGVVADAEGCTWTVEYDDGTSSIFSVPSDYVGTKECSYTSANHTLLTFAYSPNDAYDVAIYDLLSQLDFDSDGSVFVNVDIHDLEIIVNSVSSIPYLWGPSILEVRVWQ